LSATFSTSSTRSHARFSNFIRGTSSLHGYWRYDGRLSRNTGQDAVIIRFSTRAGALTMHGDAAVALLRAMGHSGTVPGAILAADLPAALQQLRRTLDAQATAAPPAPPPSGNEDEDEQEREPPVSLRMRAVPLLDMLETAIARDSDLMWERG
jgi:hypothetical protein